MRTTGLKSRVVLARELDSSRGLPGTPRFVRRLSPLPPLLPLPPLAPASRGGDEEAEAAEEPKEPCEEERDEADAPRSTSFPPIAPATGGFISSSGGGSSSSGSGSRSLAAENRSSFASGRNGVRAPTPACRCLMAVPPPPPPALLLAALPLPVAGGAGALIAEAHPVPAKTLEAVPGALALRAVPVTAAPAAASPSLVEAAVAAFFCCLRAEVKATGALTGEGLGEKTEKSSGLLGLSTDPGASAPTAFFLLPYVRWTLLGNMVATRAAAAAAAGVVASPACLLLLLRASWARPDVPWTLGAVLCVGVVCV